MSLPRPLRCSSSTDGRRCQRRRLHAGRHRWHQGNTTSTWSSGDERRHTYETDQPWVTWLFLSTDRETRITGRSRIQAHCLVCRDRTTLRIRIPRCGPVQEPVGGRHEQRVRYLLEHAHAGLRDPRDWAEPLGNPAAWPDGIPFDVFTNVADTARMEHDEHDDG